MIRTILHPSGEVRDLPSATPCTWAPEAMDGAVGIGVEIRTYDSKGERLASPWIDCDSATIAYPTTLKARLAADAAALERYGTADGGLDIIDEWGVGHTMGVTLAARSLGERCMVHLGERDGLGRRLWRLARVEIPRELLDEADRMLEAIGLPRAREQYEWGLANGGAFGWAMRLVIGEVARAGLDAAPFAALRARCHEIVGHDHGA